MRSISSIHHKRRCSVVVGVSNSGKLLRVMVKHILYGYTVFWRVARLWSAIMYQRVQPELGPSQEAALDLSNYQTQLLRALAYAQADYLIIGAKAMQAHGIKRDTGDLDLLIEPSIENAHRVDAVLRPRAQFPEGHTPAALTLPNKRIILGRRVGKMELHEVDILTSIDGIEYDELKARRTFVRSHRMDLPVVSLRDLVHMKGISSKTGNDAKTQARDLWDIDLIQVRLNELK